jgi:hypothetical protein
MSTVKEIEAAIRALPPQEREKLVEDLPAILPEMNGDAMWERIITDPRPRPALTALGDKIEAQLKTNPHRFSEIQDRDFVNAREIAGNARFRTIHFPRVHLAGLCSCVQSGLC